MDAARGSAKISAPFRTLGHAEGNSPMPASSYQQRGYLVDLIGIEPMTSSMPWKRAPSCATGPLLRKDFIYSGRPNDISQRQWELIPYVPVCKANRVSEHSAAGGEVSNTFRASHARLLHRDSSRPNVKDPL